MTLGIDINTAAWGVIAVVNLATAYQKRVGLRAVVGQNGYLWAVWWADVK